jgi:hypothetical protein
MESEPTKTTPFSPYAGRDPPPASPDAQPDCCHPSDHPEPDQPPVTLPGPTPPAPPPDKPEAQEGEAGPDKMRTYHLVGSPNHLAGAPTPTMDQMIDQARAEKISADKAAADKVISDKEAADKIIADKAAADKAAADKELEAHERGDKMLGYMETAIREHLIKMKEGAAIELDKMRAAYMEMPDDVKAHVLYKPLGDKLSSVEALLITLGTVIGSFPPPVAP